MLSATIALWEYNPHLKFIQVERVLHYYMGFTMADVVAMGEALKLYAPAPPKQMTLHDVVEDNPAPPSELTIDEDSDEAADGMQG